MLGYREGLECPETRQSYYREKKINFILLTKTILHYTDNHYTLCDCIVLASNIGLPRKIGETTCVGGYHSIILCNPLIQCYLYCSTYSPEVAISWRFPFRGSRQQGSVWGVKTPLDTTLAENDSSLEGGPLSAVLLYELTAILPISTFLNMEIKWIHSSDRVY